MHRDVIELMLQNGPSLGNEKTITDQTKDGWNAKMEHMPERKVKKRNVE